MATSHKVKKSCSFLSVADGMKAQRVPAELNMTFVLQILSKKSSEHLRIKKHELAFKTKDWDRVVLVCFRTYIFEDALSLCS